MKRKGIQYQPKGLYIFFFTEMWDRFNYYGIQSILILYLIKQFILPENLAYLQFGIFTTLAFSTPIIGGIIADRLIGYRNATLQGLILMIIGELTLSTLLHHALVLGLAFTIAGIGLFKANNATFLGKLYTEEYEHKREAGFTLFYMGMNLGAILGPLCYGLIAYAFGWKIVFLTSASLGTVVFMLYFLAPRLFKINLLIKNKLKKFTFKLKIGYFCGLFLTIIIILGFFIHPQIFSDIVWIIAVTGLIYMGVMIIKSLANERKKMMLLIILNISAIFYYALNLQIGSTMTLFVDKFVDRQFLSWTIPTEAFASLEPIFVILIAPLFAPLWTYLERKHKAPSLINRIILGLLFGAISFMIFSIITKIHHLNSSHLSLAGIILGNLFLGAGELCIGPALISAVTYLIPRKLQGTFMGFWFLSLAFAAYTASLLAKISITYHYANNTINQYAHTFLDGALLALGACFLLFVFYPLLKRFQTT